MIKGKGGDGTVKVSTGQACPWTAVANVSWVQIKGETSGTGPHDVKYDVDRNRSDFGRTGTITIGGETHVIVQGGDD